MVNTLKIVQRIFSAKKNKNIQPGPEKQHSYIQKKADEPFSDVIHTLAINLVSENAAWGDLSYDHTLHCAGETTIPG